MAKIPDTFPVTEAGQKFLEAYAEPIVTSTYLKIAVLVLAIVSSVLLLLLYRAQTAALRLKPLIISVTDSGRGQVMHYSDFDSIPIERVSKYYLARWAELYYGRNHLTLQRDFAESLTFLSDDLQDAALARAHKSGRLDSFLLDPSQSNVDIEIRAVVLEDTRKPPYRARIDFDKVFRSVGDQQEQRRERWTASVIYDFRQEVPNRMLLSNPLGLVISYYRQDQAFQN